MINWKVRLKNKHWVIAFVSQVMIVLQMILSGLNMLGLIHFELTQAIQSSVLTFINAIFVILSMLGLVQDPTTKGYGDSDRALNYKDPS
ncbi:phage holin [Neobacillus cucumis]|jgi:phi LC3 family holin|uniref:phage holin n=1 Tax=Neobacillus cucumis TaxID=1740721 RepID=UPI0018DF0812|nr:phage holin [Neobacillus cucumis]MBI0577101.1 phage holin [Neobacillus cucumis]WHY94092.1 phage holin [Neobacillus cucumis]